MTTIAKCRRVLFMEDEASILNDRPDRVLAAGFGVTEAAIRGIRPRNGRRAAVRDSPRSRKAGKHPPEYKTRAYRSPLTAPPSILFPTRVIPRSSTRCMTSASVRWRAPVAADHAMNSRTKARRSTQACDPSNVHVRWNTVIEIRESPRSREDEAATGVLEGVVRTNPARNENTGITNNVDHHEIMKSGIIPIPDSFKCCQWATRSRKHHETSRFRGNRGLVNIVGNPRKCRGHIPPWREAEDEAQARRVKILEAKRKAHGIHILASEFEYAGLTKDNGLPGGT